MKRNPLGEDGLTAADIRELNRSPAPWSVAGTDAPDADKEGLRPLDLWPAADARGRRRNQLGIRQLRRRFEGGGKLYTATGVGMTIHDFAPGARVVLHGGETRKLRLIVH